MTIHFTVPVFRFLHNVFQLNSHITNILYDVLITNILFNSVVFTIPNPGIYDDNRLRVVGNIKIDDNSLLPYWKNFKVSNR